MPLRLAIHVGPHKTGSTSVQRAIVESRERLAAEGVWYPPSLPEARWPEQHADAWLLVTRGRRAEFDAWLGEARAEAIRRGCDTLLLSSENIHAPGTRRQLRRVLADWRWRGGETRLLVVRRDLVDHACSRALSHIAGEAGFYFFHRYDLRRWARRFAIEARRHERWFERRGARFVDVAAGPREALAARILAAATDREYPWIVTGDHHATEGRLADPHAILGYGLRVMLHHATGVGVNTPEAFAEARRTLSATPADEAAFAAVAERFRDAVRRDVAAGIADFERLPGLRRRWLVWFDRSADRRPGGA